MSPEKLFDYLDGKLPTDEREVLENDLANNHALQRELAIARRIHSGMQQSGEIPGEIRDDAPATARAGAIGRKVATAFAALVLLNVLAGMFFIVYGHNSHPTGQRDLGPQEAAVRRQLSDSIQAVATVNLPAPTLGTPEITLKSPLAEIPGLVEKIVAAAARVGGSATKKYGNEDATVLFIDLPSNREAEFRTTISVPPVEELKRDPPTGGKAFLTIKILAEKQ